MCCDRLAWQWPTPRIPFAIERCAGLQLGKEDVSGQARFGQLGIPVVKAGIAQRHNDRGAQAARCKPELLREHVGIKAFHWAGGQAERRRAQQ